MSADPVARLRELLESGQRLDLISGDDVRAALTALDAAEKRAGEAIEARDQYADLYARRCADLAAEQTRATALAARCERLEAALGAAKAYAESYLLDEYDDPELTGIDQKQYAMVHAMFDGFAALDQSEVG